MTTQDLVEPMPAGSAPFGTNSRSTPQNGRHPSPTDGVRLEIHDLRHRYGGSRYALDGVSMSLGVGLTGLLGPNGAGKSTLIRCVAGIQNWEDGSIEVSGSQSTSRGGLRIGYMPETVSFPRELRVAGYLRFVCAAKGLGRAWRAEVDEKMAITGLSEVADKVVATLSKGYRQRLGLAQAMIGNPAVLLLDEPVSSLDPINIVEVRRAIRAYARSACVIVSTHQLAEARALCDRVIVLDRGRVAFEGPMTELGRGSLRAFEIELLGGDEEALRSAVADLGDGCTLRILRTGEAYVATLTVSDEQVLADRVARLVSLGGGVVGVRPVGDALEDAFAHAVAGADPIRSDR